MARCFFNDSTSEWPILSEACQCHPTSNLFQFSSEQQLHELFTIIRKQYCWDRASALQVFFPFVFIKPGILKIQSTWSILRLSLKKIKIECCDSVLVIQMWVHTPTSPPCIIHYYLIFCILGKIAWSLDSVLHNYWNNSGKANLH